jgi:hypothetical protein
MSFCLGERLFVHLHLRGCRWSFKEDITIFLEDDRSTHMLKRKARRGLKRCFALILGLGFCQLRTANGKRECTRHLSNHTVRVPSHGLHADRPLDDVDDPCVPSLPVSINAVIACLVGLRQNYTASQTRQHVSTQGPCQSCPPVPATTSK